MTSVITLIIQRSGLQPFEVSNLFIVQVPLRKTNINGRGIPPVPDDQTRFTGIGRNTNAIGSINSYPQHPHLMTTMTRTNGAEGFTTTTKTGTYYIYRI